MTNLTENSRKAIELLLLKSLTFFLIFSLTSCKNVKPENQDSSNESVSHQIDSESGLTKAKEDGFFIAHKSKSPVQIDGIDKDVIWSSMDWYAMNYLWMGKSVDPEDYQGRFKLS